MKKLLCVTLFALMTVLSFVTVPSARAATLTWTLQNLLFQDGGTATGSFGYDADTNAFSAISISTSSNASTGFGSDYALPAGFGSASVFDAITGGFPFLDESRLYLMLAAAMTNAGGTIAMNPINAFELICANDVCDQSSVFRYVTQGSITAPPAIPLPATLPLLAAGLGAMGFMGWRRKRRAA